MGYMRHHAIVVTSYSGELLEQAHAVALGLGMSVSAITGEVMNGYRSFLVAPDGSKEGWDESDRGDEQRAKLAAWLTAQAYDDGSSPIEWVEVQFGDEELESVVVRDSDDSRRRRDAEDEQSGDVADDLEELEARVGAEWVAVSRTPTWPVAPATDVATRLAGIEARLDALENPPCCKGGPQWGHDWYCDTLP